MRRSSSHPTQSGGAVVAAWVRRKRCGDARRDGASSPNPPTPCRPRPMASAKCISVRRYAVGRAWPFGGGAHVRPRGCGGGRARRAVFAGGLSRPAALCSRAGGGRGLRGLGAFLRAEH